MRSCRPPLFRKRKFEPEVIVTCVRWYLRFEIKFARSGRTHGGAGSGRRRHSDRRWVRLAPPRCIGGCTARSNENRPRGRWMRRLFGLRASGCICFVPSIAAGRRSISTALKHGNAKLPQAFSGESIGQARQPGPARLRAGWLAELFSRSPGNAKQARLPRRCRQRTRHYCNNRIESDHRHMKRRLRAMQGPRTAGWAVIQGIEAPR
jgi:hypothetical protein